MKYTLNDVRAAYAAKKREKDLKQNLLGFISYRQISLYLTPLFLNLSVSANTVTYISLLFILLLPVIALFAPKNAYILLAASCFIYHCLDYIDGNIARVTNTISRYSTYLDSFFGNIYWISVYVSVGILVDRMSPYPKLFVGSGLFYGLLAALFDMLSKVSRLYYKLYLSHGSDAAQQAPRQSVRGILYSIVSSLGYLTVPILLVSGYAGRISLTLAYCVSLTALMLMHSQYRIIRALKTKGACA